MNVLIYSEFIKVHNEVTKSKILCDDFRYIAKDCDCINLA